MTVMPKIVDHDAQRARIVQAAVAVIGRGGLESARLRDIALEAGLTTGAVMHYFADKDAVLVAALESVVDATLARTRPRATRAPRAQGRAGEPAAADDSARTDRLVRGLARALPLDEAGRAEWRAWFAFWSLAAHDARLRAVHARFYASFVDAVQEELVALRSTTLRAPTSYDKLAAEPTRVLADALVAAVDGIGVRATLEPAAWPAARQRSTLAALASPLLAQFLGADPDGPPNGAHPTTGSNQTGTDVRDQA